MNHEANAEQEGGRLVYLLPVEKHNLDGFMWGRNPVVFPWQPVTQDAPHVTALPAALFLSLSHTHITTVLMNV